MPKSITGIVKNRTVMALTPAEQKQITAVFSGTCVQKGLSPVKDVMAGCCDKWSIYTVLLLGQQPCMRFNELRVAINGISQRMLSVTLQSLEADGIVSRTLYPEIPPRVEYRLTILGEGLCRQLLALAIWSDQNVNAILRSRKKYEKKKTP